MEADGGMCHIANAAESNQEFITYASKYSPSPIASELFIILSLLQESMNILDKWIQN